MKVITLPIIRSLILALLIWIKQAMKKQIPQQLLLKLLKKTGMKAETAVMIKILLLIKIQIEKVMNKNRQKEILLIQKKKKVK